MTRLNVFKKSKMENYSVPSSRWTFVVWTGHGLLAEPPA